MRLEDSLGARAESAFRASWPEEGLVLPVDSNSAAKGLARNSRLEPCMFGGLVLLWGRPGPAQALFGE